MKEDETTTVVASTTTSSDKSFDSVVVHPLVLLSVVDHYKRVDEVRARFFFLPMRSLRVFSLFGFSMRGFVARASKSDWFCALVLRSLSLVPSLSRVRVFIVETHIARVLSLSLSLSFQKGDEDDDDDDDDDENINPRRVVGVLLGSTSNNRLDITSSFAVPFEEDPQDSSIWFLDHAYAEQMYRMHSRIHAKEKVVGWYSTGPKIRENDLDIGELFEKYCADPVLVIVNLSPTADDAPTSAYRAVLDVKEDGTMTQKEQKTHEHVPCTIEASDPEAIGVEHLLRDVKDATVSTLSTQVKEKARALRGLETRLKEIKKYMELVLDDKLPVNQEILGELQNAFNGLPNLNLESYVKAFAVETNDAQLVIYLGALIRTVIALHDLINNKMEQKERERVSDMQDAEGNASGEDATKKKEEEEKEGGKENDKSVSNKN
jgi:26S proteasome regulatory subunit N8